MHTSNFAHKLRCAHCGKIHGTKNWPINGDMVPFYYQKESGNFNLKITCPFCKKDWFVVWDDNPGEIHQLTYVKERKSVHNLEAIKRKIKFKDFGVASEACCWNCIHFSILIGGGYWCEEDMLEVDRSDLCGYWIERKINKQKKWWNFW